MRSLLPLGMFVLAACSTCAGEVTRTPVDGAVGGVDGAVNVVDAGRVFDAPRPADGGGVADGATVFDAGVTQGCPAGFTGGLTAGQHSGFRSGGQNRSFHVLLPPTSFTGPRPLVFAWHGTGETGTAFISRADLGAWRSAGWIVLAPDSNGNGELWPIWDSQTVPGRPNGANADLALFDDLVACARASLDVDATRIFTLGHSAGGAMTNHVLGQRSVLLAGGIPASGAIDWTQPPAATIEPMAVIVTWGGDNDCWEGCAGGTCGESCLVEQAALTSQYWEGTAGVHQIRCRGGEIGHAWLSGDATFMRNWLFAHPKGMTGVAGPALPASCSEAAYTWTPPVQPVCRTSTTNGCQRYCQLLGDCLVENGTLGPAAADELAALGWGTMASTCGGCVSACEADATTAADTTALACLASAALVCAPGFPAIALFDTVGGCCAGASGSNVCARYCTAFGQNALLGQFVSGCP